MMRSIGIWLLRALIAIAAVSLLAYAVDFTVYKFHGSPHSTVAVSHFMGVPLKNQKVEYDYLGTTEVTCAVALFPHGGQDPCWHLRRNANQWDNLGSPAY